MTTQDGRFSGRVAMVTGGASGIGAAVVERLAREGAVVVSADVQEQRLHAEAKRLADQALPVESVSLDITHEGAVAEAMDGIVARHGRLDILVHSAGVVGPTSTPITEYELDDFQSVLAVNLTGAFLCTKHAIRHMAPTGRGRILLVASIAGKDGNPGMVGYSASKAGLIGLVKGVGKEWADKGITVNGLAPAVVRTPMLDGISEEQLRYMESRIPMQRLGTPENIAAVIAFAVSDEAAFTTGFIFDASGGRAVY